MAGRDPRVRGELADTGRVPYAFAWTLPPFGNSPVYKNSGLIERHYKTLAKFQQAAGQDRHSVLVDYDIFQNVQAPDPSDPQRLYAPENFDFRLKARSAPSAREMSCRPSTMVYRKRARSLGSRTERICSTPWPQRRPRRVPTRRHCPEPQKAGKAPASRTVDPAGVRDRTSCAKTRPAQILLGSRLFQQDRPTPEVSRQRA